MPNHGEVSVIDTWVVRPNPGTRLWYSMSLPCGHRGSTNSLLFAQETFEFLGDFIA